MKNVQSLTTESITNTVRKHFDSDDVIVLVYTTAAETEKQLEGLGSLRKVQSVE